MKTFITSLAVALSIAGFAGYNSLAQSTNRTAKQTIVDVDSQGAERIISTNKSVVVLDVRTPKEFEKGHLPGATNMNFFADDFDQQLGKLDKSKSYLVYCASGGRSSDARDKMKEMQFKSVYQLEGGFKDWEKSGKQVAK